MTDRTIITGSEAGRWFAATAVAPYFCFEGNSEREVQQLAKAALAFFESIGNREHNSPRQSIVKLRNRVLASEIAA